MIWCSVRPHRTCDTTCTCMAWRLLLKTTKRHANGLADGLEHCDVAQSPHTACTDGGTPVSSGQLHPLSDVRDIIAHVIQFVECENFLFIATVSRTWRSVWGKRAKNTSRRVVVQSASRLAWVRKEIGREDTKMCAVAAEGGNVDALKMCRKNGYQWDATTCERAARKGHINILRSCRESTSRSKRCPWNAKTCASAAKAGRLEVLYWCRINGCPWDEETTASAAAGGHLGVLKICRARGCPWDEKCCVSAATNGHVAILAWCRINGCPWRSWDMCARAAEGGHLEVLQWCRASGCPWDARTCSAAAGRGDLEMLRWCKVNGCPWTEETCIAAASSGHLEVSKPQLRIVSGRFSTAISLGVSDLCLNDERLTALRVL